MMLVKHVLMIYGTVGTVPLLHCYNVCYILEIFCGHFCNISYNNFANFSENS